MDLKKILKESLYWLKRNYHKYNFFEERDIVWTLQVHLIEKIKNSNFKVFSEYPVSLCLEDEKDEKKYYSDLAILENNIVKALIQFKYEPNKGRKEDFRPSKLNYPTIFWDNKKGYSSVIRDIKIVKAFVDQNKNNVGYSIFIDEGGRFYNMHKHDKPRNAKWNTSWKKGMAVLIAEYSSCKG